MNLENSDHSRNKISAAADLFLCPLLIAAVCVLAHFKALSCYFFADDLLVLDYLYKIFHSQPHLALLRLVSPWQDPSISLLYRPLCDLFFFMDYALFRSNAAGYHLTNLLLHICCSLLVFLNASTIHFAVFKNHGRLAALLSALLFAGSPLHLEPVVWLVGRADLSASMFLLLSLLFAIRAFVSGRNFSPLSMLFYFLALLSKESAACQPAIVFAFCILPMEKGSSLRQALIRTLPFAVLTGVYLVLRFFVLGTFLGGYTGSFGEALVKDWWKHFLDWNQFALLGLGSNVSLFKPDSIEIILLHALYLCAAAVLVLRMPSKPWDSMTLKVMAFWFFASFIALLPAFQVAGVSGTLSNARVFYLASAFFFPLIVEALLPDMSMFEGERFSAFHFSFWIRVLPAALLFVFTSVFCLVTVKSYIPWQETSALLLDLQKACGDVLRSTPDKKKLVIIFQYGNWKGAHAIYEFKELQALLGPNFFSPDYSSRLMALDEYPDFYGASTQRLHRLIKDNADYEVRLFNAIKKEFTPVVASNDEMLTARSAPIAAAKAEDPLDKAFWISLPQRIFPDDESILEVNIDENARSSRITSFCLSEDKRLPDPEGLSVGSSSRKKVKRAYHVQTFELRRQLGARAAEYVYCTVPASDELYGARLLAGTNCAQLEPDLSRCKELPNGNYFIDKGSFALNLEVSRVPQSDGVLLELAEPDYLFSFGKVCMRDPQTYPHIQKKWRFSQTTSMTIQVPYSEFKPGHRYAFRLIALDKNGLMTGFYSDTVCLDLRKAFF